MNRYRFNRYKAWTLTALSAACLALPAWALAAEITVGKAIQHDTSAPMGDLAPLNLKGNGENKQVPIMLRDSYGRFPDLASPDGGLQSEQSPGVQKAPTPAPTVSAEGLAEQDNVDLLGVAIVPPDTNGDIGFDDLGNRIYVQYINLVWGVFDDTGALIAGPFPGNSLWNGFGGPCDINNDGDPIALYDDYAGRWVMSQFSIDEGIQCVAVSVSSDPLGAYHRYAFEVSPGKANDYPKLGVWTDGAGQSAYTFTTRDFPVGATFGGSGVMERDAMLNGDPAQFIKFENPCVGGDCIEGQLPPHMAGPMPPADTCPTFWSAVDATFDDSPFANDGYRNHTLCVDWDNLAATTYTEGPLVVAGSNFDRFLGNVSPVNGGSTLDSLPFFTMYRAQYRWFGTHASVVLNTTVDAGSERAGIRWAEARSTDGDSAWGLHQDGTFAPDDGVERWMGSIAQDQSGNIALGYSAASGALFPAVRYTSRSAGDALGTMPGGEVSCHEGTGAQTGADRWGDYSSMSVDPSDDCTFWFTTEYYETTGSFDFNTRICSFKLADCGGPPPGCTTDAECQNGSFCDGAETCNVDTGTCEPGTPPDPDDGIACTDDSCNETTDTIDNLPNDGLCQNEFFCDGAEVCNPAIGCEAGTDPCPDGSCDEAADICIGCGDGICDPGEDCNSCPSDCISGDLPGASCGNGLCEAGDGENGVNCAADCNAKLNGKPANRFSCGFGDGYTPDGCGDSRCTTGGYACTEIPVDSGTFCCGDAICEGAEDSSNCGLDCGPEPVCGNGVKEAGEDCDGGDLGGQACTDLGFDGGTLACDIFCQFDTSACDAAVCDLGQLGDSCDSNADCCSNKCKGKPGNMTCK